MVNGLSVGRKHDRGRFVTNFGSGGFATTKADRRGGISRTANRDVVAV
jgi:hypothetical protein